LNRHLELRTTQGVDDLTLVWNLLVPLHSRGDPKSSSRLVILMGLTTTLASCHTCYAALEDLSGFDAQRQNADSESTWQDILMGVLPPDVPAGGCGGALYGSRRNREAGKSDATESASLLVLRQHARATGQPPGLAAGSLARRSGEANSHLTDCTSGGVASRASTLPDPTAWPWHP